MIRTYKRRARVCEDRWYADTAADDGPSSGIRLVQKHGEMIDWASGEPARCKACQGGAGLRRLPPQGGPWFCVQCVPLSSFDEFDHLYRDIGGGD
jgi:hypothetical protein